MTRSPSDKPGSQPSGHPHRDQTDKSLKVERASAEQRYSEKRRENEERADTETQLSRTHADKQVQTSREDADRERRPQTTEGAASSGRERNRADLELGVERSSADAVRDDERATQRDQLSDLLSVERASTDLDLGGERSHTDQLSGDLREANQRMVSETLRALDLKEEADQAKARAEASELELREVAKFRELFIGILGHDLRNPLNAINMAVGSMLRRGRLEEQDARAAARIVRAAQRMTEMITQLLDLTRTRLGGGLKLSPRPTDLQEVCREVVEEFDTHCELELEGDLTGTWDPERLAEALSNLVGNALEHAAPDTPVKVKGSAEEDSVVVAIQNQGAAIPEELLPHIFDPFRGSAERRREGGGNLGLGLYIAHQIVRAHGGALTGHSEGGLTTFTLRLPRNVAS